MDAKIEELSPFRVASVVCIPTVVGNQSTTRKHTRPSRYENAIHAPLLIFVCVADIARSVVSMLPLGYVIFHVSWSAQGAKETDVGCCASRPSIDMER